jgi:hypothetical protein
MKIARLVVNNTEILLMDGRLPGIMESNPVSNAPFGHLLIERIPELVFLNQ